MSNGDRLFVMDGAVGGFEKDRSNVRVITNNADIGYLAKTLLVDHIVLPKSFLYV